MRPLEIVGRQLNLDWSPVRMRIVFAFFRNVGGYRMTVLKFNRNIVLGSVDDSAVHLNLFFFWHSKLSCIFEGRIVPYRIRK